MFEFIALNLLAIADCLLIKSGTLSEGECYTLAALAVLAVCVQVAAMFEATSQNE